MDSLGDTSNDNNSHFPPPCHVATFVMGFFTIFSLLHQSLTQLRRPRDLLLGSLSFLPSFFFVFPLSVGCLSLSVSLPHQPQTMTGTETLSAAPASSSSCSSSSCSSFSAPQPPVAAVFSSFCSPVSSVSCVVPRPSRLSTQTAAMQVGISSGGSSRCIDLQLQNADGCVALIDPAFKQVGRVWLPRSALVATAGLTRYLAGAHSCPPSLCLLYVDGRFPRPSSVTACGILWSVLHPRRHTIWVFCITTGFCRIEPLLLCFCCLQNKMQSWESMQPNPCARGGCAVAAAAIASDARQRLLPPARRRPVCGRCSVSAAAAMQCDR